MKFRTALYTLYFSTFLFFLSHLLHAQNLSVYTNYLQKFYVVENGNPMKLEHLPVQSFQVSDDLVAYVDNVGNFKVYDNGTTTQLEALVNNYEVRKGFVFYETAGVYKFYNQGKKQLLTPRAANYRTSDGVIAFTDSYTRGFKAVFDTTILTLETHSSEQVISSYRTNNNTLAYIDLMDNLYLVYKGERQLVAEYFKGKYAVGNNILAFEDSYDYSFQVYENGEYTQLETQFPKNFSAGNGLTAWISNTGAFKVFCNGNLVELGSYEPQFYTIKDDLLIYEQNGYFMLFYNGKTTQVAAFIPQEYYIDNHTLVFRDQQGYITAYIKGEFVEITRQPSTDLHLWGDIISYTVNKNEPRVWFNGEEIEF